MKMTAVLWLCLYNTETTNTRMKMTTVLMALSVHWNHKHKDDADSSPRGFVCTLKTQTHRQIRQQWLGLCLYIEIKNTRTLQTAVIITNCWTILTAVILALSVEWNYKHKHNSDSSHYGSICQLKWQTLGRCLHTEMTNTRSMSAHWNGKHKDDICTLKSQTLGRCQHTEITSTRSMSAHWNHKHRS